MSSPAATAANENADPAGAWERWLLEHQVEQLNRLAAMGMAIAGAVERQASSAEPGPDAAAILQHAAIDFGRVSRAVRLSFALQSKLIADFKSPPARPAHAVAAYDDAGLDEDGDETFGRRLPAPSSAAMRRKAKLGLLMRHVVECAVEQPERLESVLAEAAERLESDDILREIAARPFGEVIAIICRDLGLEPDWERVGHKPHRLGWATYDDIRESRDFSLSAEGDMHFSACPQPPPPPPPD